MKTLLTVTLVVASTLAAKADASVTQERCVWPVLGGLFYIPCNEGGFEVTQDDKRNGNVSMDRDRTPSTANDGGQAEPQSNPQRERTPNRGPSPDREQPVDDTPDNPNTPDTPDTPDVPDTPDNERPERKEKTDNSDANGKGGNRHDREDKTNGGTEEAEEKKGVE
jgi:hypothetical protein